MAVGTRFRLLTNTRVALIGAGIAGLACAGELVARGAKVTLFEATRSIGGRVASVSTPFGPFDPGAQYFTVHHHRFEVAVHEWLAAGAAMRWDARLVGSTSGRLEPIRDGLPRYVGVPSMGAVAMRLARDLEIQLEHGIARVRRLGGGWKLFDALGVELGLRPYDTVLVATPSPVAVGLLREHPEFVRIARGVQWEPALAALIALRQPSGAPFDAAFFNDDPVLGWAACDSTKPGRAPVSGIAERWVLHARTQWSRECFALDDRALTDHLLQAFAGRLGRPLEAEFESVLRFRDATPINPLAPAFLWDPAARIGAAGDWCAGARVESAYLSGVALAEAVAAA
jgi:renalase